jgi:hypothetical protein
MQQRPSRQRLSSNAPTSNDTARDYESGCFYTRLSPLDEPLFHIRRLSAHSALQGRQVDSRRPALAGVCPETFNLRRKEKRFQLDTSSGPCEENCYRCESVQGFSAIKLPS